MQKIEVGIVGGAGYTAGELLRILIFHPLVNILFVNSNSNAGKPITNIHSGLIGDTKLYFTEDLLLDEIDVLFLCSAHGDSKKFLSENLVPKNLRIIDLSTDYRSKSVDNDFVYGLPELNRDTIAKSRRIANPGCFATAIELALLPLAYNGLIRDDIHVNAITGSTGAGVKPSATTHFSWRNNNISVYKAFTHQHLSEIRESIVQLQPNFDCDIKFIPVRGDFARGIMATAYTDIDKSESEIRKIYEEFYANSAFTFITSETPDLKQVVNTNKALVFLQKHKGTLLVISLIDNLLKGASGQAVQNMNLMFGFEERLGLELKPIGF